MQIRKAERKKAKLRIWLSGPSWSGKTMSALLLANGITGDWTKIGLIDSENWSWELYSDVGDYNVITLDAPYSPERYIEAIKAFEEAQMEVIIIDSTSHEWDGKGGCLEINDKIASAKFKGNTWAAWSETTPRHQKFIEAIVTSKCHIITTARSKTDTIQAEDKKIKKVGTKEIQREWFEYELTINFNIDREHHLAIASKDRTGIFIDRDPFLITWATWVEVMEWNRTGIDGEALEAERKAREEKERLEKAAKEQKERDDLYNSIVADMQNVKFIDDLAEIWNTQVLPNRDALGVEYINDLTDRKNAIKEDLLEPKKQEKSPNSKKPTLKKSEIEEEPSPGEVFHPDSDTSTSEQDAFSYFIDKIKATTNEDELDEVWLEVETALGMKKIDLQQHGVLASHKGIMLKKLPIK